MKLFIDDVRVCPQGWQVARTFEEAMNFIYNGDVEEISFDHDLGTTLTGYDISKEIEQLAQAQLMGPMKWQIHSANPVGRANIEYAMKSAERFWAVTS